ncbi:TatD family hydrolase [Inquilinus sp. CAU 1745]|uniref:TatD family hydrolase n=1 Tax=Inquilinus sp. CAU 1745 TaxID=3140369 RepID=UPI00325C2C66
MLVDSHCHLDFPDFESDLDDIVARAEAAGVTRMVTICTALSRLEKSLAIAERYDSVFCAAGIHPHEAGKEGDVPVETLVALNDHRKLVGIGETGLDYHYDYGPRPAQQESFRRHIRAAWETGLPVIVHTRSADEDTIRILAEEGAGQGGEKPLTGVIHCFSTGRELAEKALEFGFYISLSGILTFNRSEDIREIVRDVPMDRLLVETDAPYLAPVPRRGKRNEPAYVAHTAERLAEVKGVSFEEIRTATTENFLNLFKKVPASA